MNKLTVQKIKEFRSDSAKALVAADLKNSIEVFLSQSEAVIATLDNIRKGVPKSIASEEDYRRIVDSLRRLTTLEQVTEKKRKKVTEPLHAVQKQAIALQKEMLAEVSTYKEEVDLVLKNYQVKQREEEQEKLRLAEEAAFEKLTKESIVQKNEDLSDQNIESVEGVLSAYQYYTYFKESIRDDHKEKFKDLLAQGWGKLEELFQKFAEDKDKGLTIAQYLLKQIEEAEDKADLTKSESGNAALETGKTLSSFKETLANLAEEGKDIFKEEPVSQLQSKVDNAEQIEIKKRLFDKAIKSGIESWDITNICQLPKECYTLTIKRSQVMKLLKSQGEVPGLYVKMKNGEGIGIKPAETK